MLDSIQFKLNFRPYSVFSEIVVCHFSGNYIAVVLNERLAGEEMASYVELGFKAVKMKTGRLTPQGEESRVKAAREAIGPDVELMLDCNNG